MEREELVGEVLARPARGEAPLAERECAALWEDRGDPVAAALASVAAFWRGDFAGAARWAGASTGGASDDTSAALGLAATTLAAAGDADADGEPSWSAAMARVRTAGDPSSPWWSAVRYLLAEAALVSARLTEAARALEIGPPTGDAWRGHPYEPVLRACDVRVAAFSGDISAATALLDPLRASVTRGERSEWVVEAVAALVLGNADDPEGVRRSIELSSALEGAAEHDFVDRGVMFLLAFGAIAVGDVATAARLVLRAGGDGDLSLTTVIDRALGLELLVVAALAEDDLAAAEAWLGSLEGLAHDRAAGPVALRARARHLIAVGDIDAAIDDLCSSVAACRADGRGVEAAEGEIVLARARILAQDVASASQDLRNLVSASDATGHHAVRRSAASTLQPARRRLPPVAGGGWAVLSEREREVALLVLDGHEIEEIAALLFVSPATVRAHVSRVLCAFGVPTRIGLLAAARPERPASGSVAPPLSPRQRDVARLVASGQGNQQIAGTLGISVKGVEKHVGDVLVRWGVRSRFEIARLWWDTEGSS